MLEEKWLSIINFSRYEISSFGNVRNIKTLKNLKLRLNHSGYVNLCILNDQNEHKSVLVHRLVGETFIENKNNKKTIHHINFIRNDNRVENLEWSNTIEQNNKKRDTLIISHLNNVIWRLSLDNEKIEKYDFLKDAVSWCIQNNIHNSQSVRTLYNNISKVCKNKQSSAYGYKWCYDIYNKNDIWEEVPIIYSNNLKNVFVSTNGKIKYNNNKITYGYKNVGYLSVSLNKKTFFIHRIVAQTFIQNPENKLFVNHKDGNKLNNNINNLEWVTHQENIQHAINNKLSPITKEVIQFDLNMNIINIFFSINEASKILNIKRQNIALVCKNINLTAGGFRFLFKHDYIPEKKYVAIKNNNKKSVIQLNINGEIIKIYESITNASIELKLQNSHISSCCKGKRQTTGGFKFMYLSDYNTNKKEIINA
jgi:hypothetical protein